MAEEYTIHPLEVGRFTDRDKSSITYLQGFGQKQSVPILVFVIKGNGKTILVDTGASGPAHAATKHLTLVQTEDMKIIKALNGIGVTADSIDFLINTHLHWDHCFNNNLFPGKKIYVQKSEFGFAMDPWPVFRSTYDHYKAGLTPPWECSIPHFEFVDGDPELLEGIKLVKMPGHSPGSQGVMVDTSDGKYLICGDAIPAYEIWDAPGRGMIGVFTSMDEQMNTYKKLEAMGEFNILPGHDARVLAHSEYPF